MAKSNIVAHLQLRQKLQQEVALVREMNAEPTVDSVAKEFIKVEELCVLPRVKFLFDFPV